MVNVKIKYVALSRNKKTGMVSQVYSEPKTCPTRCPFRNSGCYAKYGHCRIAWDGVSEDVNDLGRLIREKGSTELIRHNVAGDIAIAGTSDIDEDLVNVLISAYKGKKAYTYTHCTVNDRNIAIVKNAISKGFVINFSCETLNQVVKCYENNVPCVMAVNTISKDSKKREGITFKKCPASDSVNCANCKMCANKNRKSVVVFEAHGAGRKKALNANFLMEL